MPHQQRSYYIPFVEARDITIDQLCDSNFVDGYLELSRMDFKMILGEFMVEVVISLIDIMDIMLITVMHCLII